MPFGKSDTFEIKPVQSTVAPWPIAEWQADPDKKRQFGIELAKHEKAFDAALIVYEDAGRSLWASQNLLNDPIVIGARDAYTNQVDLSENLLDKNQLALKLLKISEEKDPSGRFYLLEGKDRIATLKLYAEVQGYIGKINIDASTNSFVNNELKIVLVKAPTKEEPKVVEHKEINNNLNINPLPLNIKLVNAR
jgi:hypothetical protein